MTVRYEVTTPDQRELPVTSIALCTQKPQTVRMLQEVGCIDPFVPRARYNRSQPRTGSLH